MIVSYSEEEREMEGLSVRRRAANSPEETHQGRVDIGQCLRETPLLVIDITSVAATILHALTGLRPLRLHELGYTIPGTVDTGDSSPFLLGHIAFYEQGMAATQGCTDARDTGVQEGRRLEAAIATDTAG